MQWRKLVKNNPACDFAEIVLPTTTNNAPRSPIRLFPANSRQADHNRHADSGGGGRRMRQDAARPLPAACFSTDVAALIIDDTSLRFAGTMSVLPSFARLPNRSR